MLVFELFLEDGEWALVTFKGEGLPVSFSTKAVVQKTSKQLLAKELTKDGDAKAVKSSLVAFRAWHKLAAAIFASRYCYEEKVGDNIEVAFKDFYSGKHVAVNGVTLSDIVSFSDATIAAAACPCFS